LFLELRSPFFYFYIMKLPILKILGAVLCVGLLIGCGSDDDDDSSDSSVVNVQADNSGVAGADDVAVVADAGDAADVADAGDAAAEDPNVAGGWTGARDSAGGSSAITMNFTQGDLGHMWSLGGSYVDSSLPGGTITGGMEKGSRTVSFAVILMAGGVPTGDSVSYRGEVSADGNTISGSWDSDALNGTWSVSR
jgi:hypothetical protein